MFQILTSIIPVPLSNGDSIYGCNTHRAKVVPRFPFQLNPPAVKYAYSLDHCVHDFPGQFHGHAGIGQPLRVFVLRAPATGQKCFHYADIEQHGKSYVIVDDERARLDQTHENWVSRRQGKNPSQAPGGGQPQPQGNGQSQGQRRDAPPQGGQQNGQQGQRQQNNQRRQQPSQRQQPEPGTFQPVQQPSPASDAPSPAGTGLREGFYLVRGAVLKPTVSGESRTSVQLQNCAGQCLQAYTQGPDSRLAPGVTLYNVKISSRSSNGVTFYTLDAYDIVTYTAQDAA